MKNLILKYLRSRKNTSASVAKERLQIIISHERSQQDNFHQLQLPKLQNEILQVLKKYISIDERQVKVQLEQVGDQTVLELNITFPDKSLETKQPMIEKEYAVEEE